MKAEGVTYKEMAGCARTFFRCDAYAATLSVEACSGRFVTAQTAKDEALEPLAYCRSCRIGAAHRGVDVPIFASNYESMICPRCGKGTTRMIGNRRCVSCYNREREIKVGRDRRGKPPITVPVPVSHAIQTVIDGALRVFRDNAINTGEMVAHILRTIPGAIYFTKLRN